MIATSTNADGIASVSAGDREQQILDQQLARDPPAAAAQRELHRGFRRAFDGARQQQPAEIEARQHEQDCRESEHQHHGLCIEIAVDREAGAEVFDVRARRPHRLSLDRA